MDTEDLYPNDPGAASLFGEPDDSRDQAEREEQAKAFTTMPLIGDFITRLDARIKLMNTLDALPTDDKTTPNEVLAMIQARKLTMQFLTEEKAYFETIVREYGGQTPRK